LNSPRCVQLYEVDSISCRSDAQETAEREHEAFLLRQKVALSAEIRQTLDSWVRYEAQQRESEQRELVKTVRDKVLAGLNDQKTQRDILAAAVSDIEGEGSSLSASHG
jgi:F-type H+-transporting ATPase subunit b